MDLVAKKIIVKGRVQGVGFRQYTVQCAKKFNIRGTVRNLYNGDVECVAIGVSENMEKFIKLLKKGPVLSRVEHLDIQNVAVDPKIVDFKIIY
ncbi:MAG: acylphosphatase [Leptonema sp. (in: bacteria)]